MEEFYCNGSVADWEGLADFEAHAAQEHWADLSGAEALSLPAFTPLARASEDYHQTVHTGPHPSLYYQPPPAAAPHPSQLTNVRGCRHPPNNPHLNNLPCGMEGGWGTRGPPKGPEEGLEDTAILNWTEDRERQLLMEWEADRRGAILHSMPTQPDRLPPGNPLPTSGPAPDRQGGPPEGGLEHFSRLAEMSFGDSTGDSGSSLGCADTSLTDSVGMDESLAGMGYQSSPNNGGGTGENANTEMPPPCPSTSQGGGLGGIRPSEVGRWLEHLSNILSLGLDQVPAKAELLSMLFGNLRVLTDHKPSSPSSAPDTAKISTLPPGEVDTDTDSDLTLTSGSSASSSRPPPDPPSKPLNYDRISPHSPLISFPGGLSQPQDTMPPRTFQELSPSMADSGEVKIGWENHNPGRMGLYTTFQLGPSSAHPGNQEEGGIDLDGISMGEPGYLGEEGDHSPTDWSYFPGTSQITGGLS